MLRTTRTGQSAIRWGHKQPSERLHASLWPVRQLSPRMREIRYYLSLFIVAFILLALFILYLVHHR